MTRTLALINPFYAARLTRRAAAPEPQPTPQPVYARLPLAPVNASPVPHLTSLYHFHRAGEYGDRAYPGNCGGNLIKDLLQYFRPNGMVCDPLCCAKHNWDYVVKFLMWPPSLTLRDKLPAPILVTT